MTGTRHRQPIYYEVVKFLQENPLGGTNDGHKWLSLLMKHEQHAMRMVAVRIVEVRTAYLREDFDWEKAERLARDGMKVSVARVDGMTENGRITIDRAHTFA
jgi:biotin-(acetyl-CoA carboxylase) ligase